MKLFPDWQSYVGCALCYSIRSMVPPVLHSTQPGQLYVINSTSLVPIMYYYRLILGAADTVMSKQILSWSLHSSGGGEKHVYKPTHGFQIVTITVLILDSGKNYGNSKYHPLEWLKTLCKLSLLMGLNLGFNSYWSIS